MPPRPRHHRVEQLERLAPAADLRPLGSDRGWTSLAVTVDRGAVVASWLPGLGVVALCVALSFGVHRVVPSVSPLVTAVGIGAVLANSGLMPERANPGLHVAARHLLRVGVVLLGLRLAVGEVLDLGAVGFGVVAVVVTATFFGTQWLGRRLGVSPALSLLTATGFSICGASAIAAMEGVTDAEEEEVAFSIGLVTLCGSLAIVVLPLLAGPLGLDGAQFGTWVGASVHDVAQVVATASTAGSAALTAAVVVKLTRVVLLAPMVAGVSLARRRSTTDQQGAPQGDAPLEGRAEGPTRRPPIMPLFVVGFLAAIALRSTGWVPDAWLGAAAAAEQIALTAALVGLGAGVKVSALRSIGGRPLLLAAISWLLVGGVAYLAVRVTG